MKLPALAITLMVSVTLVGCSEELPAATQSSQAPAPASVAPSIAYEDIPPVTEADVLMECASYSESAIPVVRQQADLVANGVQYRIATVACGEYASEVSAEVVESFVADNGVWASNGLVSGSDVPFNTTGPCESDNTTIKCPAYVLGEEGEAIGFIEVTGQDNGLVWTFVSEEVVPL
jgi:hypothetical protein